jgi:uncharacterized protein YukE
MTQQNHKTSKHPDKNFSESDTFLFPRQNCCSVCQMQYRLVKDQSKVFCPLCTRNVCSQCLKKNAVLPAATEPIKICEKCYTYCWENPLVKELQLQVSQANVLKLKLNQQDEDINTNRIKALEDLRANNVMLTKLQDNWNSKHARNQTKIEKLNENIKLLKNSIAKLEKTLEEHKITLEQVDRKSECIKLNIQDLKNLEIKDKEKISHLETLISDQIEENNKIQELIRLSEEKKTKDEEDLKIDEKSLNYRLLKTKEQEAELIKQNQVLKKRLKDLKDQEHEETIYSRVSLESRGESYKGLLNQWACQEVELKALQEKLNSPMIQRKCVCFIT